MKLTDKPLSFGYSVVDSHSSFCPSKSKNPPVYAGGFSLNQVKLTDKSGKINHTSGICSVCVVLYHRLYPTLYHNDSPEIYSLSVVSKLLLYGQCFDFVT
ncbi:hypothetical protein E1470_c32560 [Escherichia coli ECC-1470]|nr:hypothetical protein E1470_c32560 [Escherichia coli ECC-1470]EFO1409541.1 hypothetical protein [Escherichia coli]HAJ7313844.1 hypothetical protein [Escherichia coli]HAJ7326239.1 hypothetical protein [Escherichia coli]